MTSEMIRLKEKTFLDRIVEVKRQEIAQAKGVEPLRELKAKLRDLPPARDFRAALTGSLCAVIAEFKKASPSRGIIRGGVHPLEIVSVYEAGGAAAISILTEHSFFAGDGQHLAEISKQTGIPILRKDFIVDPWQIYETKYLGGDALLLIARILTREELREFISLTVDLGLTPLVEIHNEEELEKSLAVGAQVIGVNNRNLDTFVTDIGTSLKLSPLIPEGVIKVSESGIACRRDVEILMGAGIHAFLVGEALMRSGDIGRKLRELMGREIEHHGGD
jgi:indole-3-glycerol phosphate synthase